ncbi:MAG TPA: Uma2 family endonuclease [Gemmataceae bacterium]|nr:Uma2 family endonuclease [Gemmataceae bacterium]
MATRLKDDPDVEHGVYYPSSDGEPMAETPVHARCMVLLFQALEDFFRDRPDVYVALNMNWYWEEGNPRARRAPDVMVVPGVGQRERNSFRSWNEGGAVPAVCFELASKKTWRANLGPVRDDYEAQGVREYFIFDPRVQFLDEPLMGFRLRRGRYDPIRPDHDGGMMSRQLNVRLVPEGEFLRLIDQRTGKPVLTKDERIAQETARADALAAEVERLKAQLKASGKSPNGGK